MRRNIASSVLAMAWLSTTAVAALQEQGPTVADRFKALVHEYETITGGRVDSDEERLKVIARVFQRRSELGLQLVELAESHPKDPLAIDALIQAVWQVNTNPWPVEVAGQDPVAAKALTLLERDHLQSDRLGPLCQRISHGFREEYEKFLRAAATSAAPAVRGVASFSLACLLSNRAQRLDTIRVQPKRVEDFEGLFGSDYIQRLLKQDSERALAEAEALLEKVAAKEPDAVLPEGGTIGERAASELFGLRHLRVGKVAPEIEGEDQDGQRFKLSDYRGKVVLLDFWHQQ